MFAKALCFIALGAMLGAEVRAEDDALYLQFVGTTQRRTLYMLAGDPQRGQIVRNEPFLTRAEDVADPSPVEKDGVIHVAYTVRAWVSTKVFEIVSSSDLVKWSAPVVVDLSIIGTGDNFRTWAPDLFVDADGNILYHVSVSTDGGATFNCYRSTATNGVSEWLAPEMVDIGGISAIDFHLSRRAPGQYQLWFKRAGGFFGLATGPTARGPWKIIADGVTDTLTLGAGEAPFTVNTPDGVLLYVDKNLASSRWSFAKSATGYGGWSGWTPVETPVYEKSAGPEDGAHHGGVLRLTGMQWMTRLLLASLSASNGISSYTGSQPYAVESGTKPPFMGYPHSWMVGTPDSPVRTLTLGQPAYAGYRDRTGIAITSWNNEGTTLQRFDIEVAKPGEGYGLVFRANGQTPMALFDDGRAYLGRLFVDQVTLTPLGVAPASPAPGTIYHGTDGHFYGWNGTTWNQLD